MLKRHLLSVIAFVMAFLWLGVHSAHATDILKLDQFDKRLSECDVVNVTVAHNQISASQVEIVLDMGERIFSWKGVGVNAANGQYFEINANQGPASDRMFLNAHDVMTAKSILLGKAKFAGFHQGVYEIQDLASIKGGDRITFNWIQDVCYDFSGNIDKSSLPTWVPPGKTIKASISIVPYFAWYPDQLLHVHFEASLGIQAIPVTTTVTRNAAMSAVVEFKSGAVGDTIRFKAWVNQRGGDSATLIDTLIPVRSSPPVIVVDPPKLVTVPNVIGMSLAQARKVLATIDLDVASQGRDESVSEWDQVVVAQDKGAGSEVLRHVKINLWLSVEGFTAPDGVSELQMYNCRTTELQLWEYVADHWVPRVAIPAMWNDGLCPGVIPPVKHTTTNGALQFFVVTEPLKCPDANSGCWTYSVWLKGNANGQPALWYLNN